MDVLRDLVKRFIKGHKDVVGVDLTAADVPVVRLRRNKESVELVAADLIPAAEPSSGEATPEAVRPISLPTPVRAPYAALAIPSPRAIVKLINLPGRFSEKDEQNLSVNLGVADDDSFRIGYRVVSEGHGRGETRILAVAVPEADVQTALHRFPRGKPAPCAIEISGLAALSGFEHGLGGALDEKTVGVMDGSDHCTTFAIFHHGTPILIRRIEFGCESVLKNVAGKLGIDTQTAQGFMDDGSFDISSILRASLEPYLKQIVISKEFVERRENCRLSEILVCGCLSAVRGASEVVGQLVNVDVRTWNPFSGLVSQDGALAEGVAGREARFVAAFGAAMDVLMEES